MIFYGYDLNDFFFDFNSFIGIKEKYKLGWNWKLFVIGNFLVFYIIKLFFYFRFIWGLIEKIW